MGIAKILGITPAKIDGVAIGNFSKISGSSSDMGNDANTLVLLHMDGLNDGTTFTDETGRIWTPKGTAKTSTTQQRFGSASMKVPGYTANYIETPQSSDFSFGTGPFTVELWFYAVYKASYNLYYTTTSTSEFSLAIGGTEVVAIVVGTIVSTPCTITEDTWHHLAIVRENSGIFKIYLNGTQILLSPPDFSSKDIQCSGVSRVGWTMPGSFNGYIDEVRVSNVARYTANFVPQPYPFTYSSGDVSYRQRVIFAGGAGSNVIEYVDVETQNNTTDFGDLAGSRNHLAGTGSSSRALFAGGGSSNPDYAIDYVDFLSLSNATTFGDLSVVRHSLSALASSTRALFSGGISQYEINSTTIDYVTIATTGSATDYGDLTLGRFNSAATSSPTRGIIGGGAYFELEEAYFSDTIDYVTISTTGNATDFGDLAVARYHLGAASSSTRGIFAGGTPTVIWLDTIEYVTIATTGNTTDFGDLTEGSSVAGAGAGFCAYFGGIGTYSGTTTIDYITIATTGNAANFGQLTADRYALAAASNAHGGL